MAQRMESVAPPGGVMLTRTSSCNLAPILQTYGFPDHDELFADRTLTSSNYQEAQKLSSNATRSSFSAIGFYVR